jgi:hypothetical protein
VNPDGSNVDRITDYGSGDIVDLSQVLSVAAGTNIATGGYVRVTSGGLIQVDLDGGGNSWVTMSLINNGGAVTFKYVSGGSAATASVSRTSVSSASMLAMSSDLGGSTGQHDMHGAGGEHVMQVADLLLGPDLYPQLF